MPYPHADLVIGELWRSSPDEPEREVYAILDAARDESIYRELIKSDAEYCCLYRGDQAEELAEVAPYLVHLRKDAAFTFWLVSQGWGQSWGIFLKSAATLNELRRHFRRFLMVYDPDGKPLYFRYYDPRVLRVYLPTCNAEELRIIFGPTIWLGVEGEDTGSLIEYRCGGFEVTQRMIRLAAK